jgi:hypothetical protein
MKIRQGRVLKSVAGKSGRIGMQHIPVVSTVEWYRDPVATFAALAMSCPAWVISVTVRTDLQPCSKASERADQLLDEGDLAGAESLRCFVADRHSAQFRTGKLCFHPRGVIELR